MGSRMPLSRARLANPGAVVERDFVLDDRVVEPRWVDPASDPFRLFPILLKRARFCRVNRAGSDVGCVARVARARFARGLASSSSSCRFSGGGLAGTNKTQKNRSWLARASR